ncbi:MAG: YggS family pyridoxal phosphate-dependent enzyme [Gammaproteobacteria bacterium]|nr:YggS family pyridoxal phosphate-dependent enzyme [Gammaproteobacteria bacterium]
MSELVLRWLRTQARLRQALAVAGRGAEDAMLLAVSKRHPASAIAELFEAGQACFGESYLQEALDKQAELADLPIEWHFIGPIQSNKTRAIASQFTWVHSVERVKIAQRLSEQRPVDMGELNICLQVNISREASKSGFLPEELMAAAEKISKLPRLKMRGLMAIPRDEDDYQRQREPFRQLAELQQQLNDELGLQLDTLSMGMSGDLEAAVKEGAAIVRVGTDIFGARQ